MNIKNCGFPRIVEYDGHHNKNGHHAIAELIAEHIKGI